MNTLIAIAATLCIAAMFSRIYNNTKLLFETEEGFKNRTEKFIKDREILAMQIDEETIQFGKLFIVAALITFELVIFMIISSYFFNPIGLFCYLALTVLASFKAIKNLQDEVQPDKQTLFLYVVSSAVTATCLILAWPNIVGI